MAAAVLTRQALPTADGSDAKNAAACPVIAHCLPWTTEIEGYHDTPHFKDTHTAVSHGADLLQVFASQGDVYWLRLSHSSPWYNRTGWLGLKHHVIYLCHSLTSFADFLHLSLSLLSLSLSFPPHPLKKCQITVFLPLPSTFSVNLSFILMWNEKYEGFINIRFILQARERK